MLKPELELKLMEQIEKDLCGAAGGLLIWNYDKDLTEKLTVVAKEFLELKVNREKELEVTNG